ncbi:MAG: hypothetical protein IPJ04_17790 [Candidatus Eisenbacteria bacterium]|nr:hypothetical protein [Candidatus Eisenbacteria bacterium]
MLSDGTLAWGAGGVVVCNDDSTQESPQIVADRIGGAVVSWEDRRHSHHCRRTCGASPSSGARRQRQRSLGGRQRSTTRASPCEPARRRS